jgi:predicted O-methyltransferase YrrM
MPDVLFLPEEIHKYLLAVSLREPPLLRRLREETAAMPNSNMQIAPEYGQFMALLIQLIGARRTIEVGVFTGYSSLAVALALPPEGQIVACDVSEEYTAVARRYWKEAGVDHMIDLRLRPAMETLRELMAQGSRGTFDFVFIDADKTGYEGYYECALELLRPGGVVMVDNVLWSGRVCDSSGDRTPDTVALRAFNEKLHRDTRVAMSMLPLGDGVTVALKR